MREDGCPKVAKCVDFLNHNHQAVEQLIKRHTKIRNAKKSGTESKRANSVWPTPSEPTPSGQLRLGANSV
ncbi:hypothetical protein GPALN_010784 [Globodera pallida]|nr:hypothetical protein GPALN_010784 [Globodera pallida]